MINYTEIEERLDTTMNNVVEEGVSVYSSQDFVTLDAWKKSRELKNFVFRNVIPELPKIEEFNLNLQLRKAIVSVTANIAEGYGRFHYQDSMQFYRISRGSLLEVKDHLISCSDFGYINDGVFKESIELVRQACIKLNGYIKFIDKQKSNQQKVKELDNGQKTNT